MKKYKKETVTREREVILERTCDLCGIKAQERGGDEWYGKFFDINETEIEVIIRQRDGVLYPEGGSGTRMSVDMCPRCFKNKLIPWLESQGASIDEVDWDV